MSARRRHVDLMRCRIVGRAQEDWISWRCCMKSQMFSVGRPVELGGFRQVRLQSAAHRRRSQDVYVLRLRPVAIARPKRNERIVGGEAERSDFRISELLELAFGQVAVA